MVVVDNPGLSLREDAARWTPRLALFLRHATAALLLVAAGLKWHEAHFWGGADSRLQTALLVAFEVALACLLIFNLYPRFTKWLTVAAFSAFAVFNLWQAFHGAASCGCFGVVKIDPNLTALFDAAIAMAFATLPTSSPPRGGLRLSGLAVTPLLTLATGASLLVPGKATAIGLVCDEPVHDFGIIMANDAKREHTFVLRNTSDRPIRIVDRFSTCGCTIASSVSDPIAPGSSSRVHIQVDWTDRVGFRSEEVRLRTDSAANAVNLIVRGTVQAHLFLSPTSINFGDVLPGQTKQRQVVIGSREDQSFEILSYRCTNPVFRLTPLVEKTISGEQRSDHRPLRKFLVSVDCLDVSGLQTGIADFHTDRPDQPDLHLNLKAFCLSRLRTVPTRLFFDAAADKQVEDLELYSIDDPSPFIAVESGPFQIVHSASAGQSALGRIHVIRVRLEYRPQMSSDLSGALKIRSNGTDLSVPLNVKNF